MIDNTSLKNTIEIIKNIRSMPTKNTTVKCTITPKYNNSPVTIITTRQKNNYTYDDVNIKKKYSCRKNPRI